MEEATAEVVQTKFCRFCNSTKPLIDFPTNKSNTTDGHHARCKECMKDYQKQWKAKHPGITAAYVKKSYKKHIDKRRTASRNYAKENRAKKTEAYKSWRHRNPDKARAASRRHYDKSRAWLKDRPEITAYHALVRRRMVKQAQPAWLTKEHLEDIRSIYKSAQALSEFHEEPYHVDHIEPIKGVNEKGEHISSGLHVPWNLRVLPAKENLSKSNKLKQY